MTRTDSYRFTITDRKDPKVAELRAQLKGKGQYVKLQGRLGRNNPKADDPRLHRRGAYAGAQIIPADIAERFDVYVYEDHRKAVKDRRVHVRVRDPVLLRITREFTDLMVELAEAKGFTLDQVSIESKNRIDELQTMRNFFK